MGNRHKTKAYKHKITDWCKRVFDVLFSLFGLIILSPIFLGIALRIKRDSKGPVFFRGRRAGKNGIIFKILKFRTMVENADSYQGPPVTAKDDPRITPFGRWLRETKLNEIPQFWNVFRGDMSLVGPRPEDPEIVKTWEAEVRDEVLSVRPGISSPASVLYRDEENMLHGSGLMDRYLGSILPSKLRLDQLYVRHRSLILDIDVLFWTIILIFPKLKKYELPEGRLFSGPLFRFMNRFFNWFLIDLIICLIAIGLTGVFWRSFGPLDVGWSRAILIAIAYAFLFSLTGIIMGVNRISWSNASGEDVLILAPAVVIGTVLAVVFNFIAGVIFWKGEWIWGAQSLIPQGMVLFASMISFLGFIFVRFRYRILLGLEKRWLSHWTELPFSCERVLIIGGGESGQLAAALLSTSSYSNHFRIMGFVDDDLYKQDIRIQGVDVIGRRENIPDLVEKMDIGIILFAIHNISPHERNHLIEICTETKARTIVFPDIPAALNTVIMESTGITPNDKENGVKKDSDLIQVGHLPCYLCLMKFTPILLERWIIEMEQKANSGDMAGLQETLAEIREAISVDVTIQQKANLEVE